MIKCSICSYQCDNWFVSIWRLACHINSILHSGCCPNFAHIGHLIGAVTGILMTFKARFRTLGTFHFDSWKLFSHFLVCACVLVDAAPLFLSSPFSLRRMLHVFFGFVLVAAVFGHSLSFSFFDFEKGFWHHLHLKVFPEVGMILCESTSPMHFNGMCNSQLMTWSIHVHEWAMFSFK